MELKKLKKHIRTLATLPETNEPVVSCYMRVENGQVKHKNAYKEFSSPLKQDLSAQKWQKMRDALAPIRAYLDDRLLLDAKGVAIFSRAGDDPFFLPLQFRVYP